MNTIARKKSAIDYTSVKSLLSRNSAAYVRLCSELSGASLNDVVNSAIEAVMASGFVILDGAYLTEIPAKISLSDLHAMSATEAPEESSAEAVEDQSDADANQKELSAENEVIDQKASALFKSGAKAAPAFNIKIEPMKASKSR